MRRPGSRCSTSFLRARASKPGEQFVPFDQKDDYDAYVDGKPRYDGRALLPRLTKDRAARGQAG